MLYEFALSPEILLSTSYGIVQGDDFIVAEDHGHLALCALWKGIERGGVIRNLAGGHWLKHIDNLNQGWHPRTRELLKKLRTAGRIVDANSRKEVMPENEQGWLDEAFASHQVDPKLSQFFGTDTFCRKVKSAEYQGLPVGISKLPFCTPFSGGGCSVKVRRVLADYVAALKPLIRYSRSLMFIDPYLDLAAANYKDFLQLLKEISTINPKVHLELHRQLKEADPKAQMRSAGEWQARFEAELKKDPDIQKLNIDIFIWDEFHDRYLVSDLMGLSIPYGFDTSAKKDETRWTVLAREDADDVRLEFSDGDPHKRRRQRLP